MSVVDYLSNEFYLRKINSNVAAGQYEGYNMILNVVNSSDYNYILEIGAYKEGENHRLPQLLDHLLDPKKTDILNTNATVIIKIKKTLMGEKIENTLSNFIEEAIPILRQNGYSTGSFHSGINDGTVKLVQIGQGYVFLTSSEFHQAFEEIEYEKEVERNTSENFLLGTLSTIVIAIAGALLYALVGKLGYYVWAIPFFLIAGAYNVYKRVAKKASMISFFIIVILIAISILAGTVIEYAWHLYDAYKDYGATFMEALQVMPEIILTEPEVKAEYIKDIAINGFVLLIAAVWMFIDIKKNEVRYAKVKDI